MTNISSLPPEILTEIFLACDHRFSEDQGLVWERCLPNPLSPPLVLAHVCARWRLVALNTPILWSALALTWNEHSVSKRAQLCKFWLNHAKSLPLTLSMVESGSCSSTDILTTILPFKSCWKRVRLSLNHSASHFQAELSRLNDSSAVSLSHLESLEVEKATGDEGKWFTLHEYPNLCRLVLGYGFAYEDIGRFPWHQLTHLGLHHPFPVARVFEVLRECSRLSYLEMTVYTIFDEEGCSPTTLPLVSKFHFRPLSLLSSPFLDALTLPRLTSLIFFDEQEISIESISAFVQRAQLTHLELVFEYHASDRDTVELLHAIPHLKSLTVSGRYSFIVHDNYGDFFLQNLAASVILPELKTLTVNIPLTTTETRLMELLTRRGCLERVYLTFVTVSDQFKIFLDARKAQVEYSIAPCLENEP